MAEDTLTKAGDNIAGLQKEVNDAINDIITLMGERTEINELIGEKRAMLVAKGLNRDAFASVIKFKRADVDQREAYDSTYALCREAIGLPVEGEQFKLMLEEGNDAPADAGADSFEEDDDTGEIGKTDLDFEDDEADDPPEPAPLGVAGG